ncbi:MAG TPA: hypothetical protein VLE53_10315 [Gemmatimonadaceae bacterium]|nr:hypothetical protein [Gemmatimonadaceae bacterium]
MATPAESTTAGAVGAWPLRVREHIDLWLHGFALLHRDSTLVPYFRPGYAQRVAAERRRLGLTSRLDTDAGELRGRLVANPALLSAQFVALYFERWEELRTAADLLVRLDGDPRRANTRRDAEAVATMATYFPSAADRDWLLHFLEALEDEHTRFFAQFWRAEQRRLGPTFDRADALWRNAYRQRFATFLRNSRQREGDLFAALALAGEGRTLTGGAGAGNSGITVVVGYPSDSARAIELVYVFAHEIVGSTANAVVLDNSAPADRRSGLADQWASLAAVRGGALLLQRVAPELVEGYQRYYLALAGQDRGAESETRFATVFPLPDPIRGALERQIDIILGGI